MSVAHTYANALLQAAQEKKEDAILIEQQLKATLSMLSQSRDLEIALNGPLISSREKGLVISELSTKCQFSALTRNFLTLLAKKGRFSQLPEIYTAFVTSRLAASGGIMAQLVSAEPLAEAELKSLITALSKKTGKKVVVQSTLDPAVLAGVKVTVGGVTYDGTLQSQLEKMRATVTQGLKQ